MRVHALVLFILLAGCSQPTPPTPTPSTSTCEVGSQLLWTEPGWFRERPRTSPGYVVQEFPANTVIRVDHPGLEERWGSVVVSEVQWRRPPANLTPMHSRAFPMLVATAQGATIEMNLDASVNETAVRHAFRQFSSRLFDLDASELDAATKRFLDSRRRTYWDGVDSDGRPQEGEGDRFVAGIQDDHRLRPFLDALYAQGPPVEKQPYHRTIFLEWADYVVRFDLDATVYAAESSIDVEDVSIDANDRLAYYHYGLPIDGETARRRAAHLVIDAGFPEAPLFRDAREAFPRCPVVGGNQTNSGSL